ncbi:MAG: hypothetical protein SGPRY_002002 [Prymnesium sp.]
MRAFAAEMGGAVLERRYQDADYVRRPVEQVALLQAGFVEHNVTRSEVLGALKELCMSELTFGYI